MTPPTAGAQPFPGTTRAVVTLVLLFLVYIFSYVDRQILSLLVAPIRADLGVSDLSMGLLQGFAFSLFFCVCGIPLGRVADYANRKLVIAAGIFSWSLMTVLCGFATSFTMLFLFRMGVGVGEASLSPAVYSILADSFPRHRLVRATSVMAQGPMIGAGLSLLVGGAIVQHLNGSTTSIPGLAGFHPWQQAFIIAGVPGFLLALVVLCLREPARQGRHDRDALPFGATVRALWARRAVYGSFYISGMTLSVVTFSAMTWFPTHLMRSFHMSPGETGAILGVVHLFGGAVGAIAGSALTEWFLKRGHAAAYMRTVLVVALLIIPSMIAPFLPTVGGTIAVWVVAVILQCSYSGSIYAALNIVTPNAMRAFNTALIVLVANMFGLAVGSAAIGGLAAPLFGNDPGAIGKALAVVGVTMATIAAFTAWRALPRLEAVFRDAQHTDRPVIAQERTVLGDSAAQPAA